MIKLDKPQLVSIAGVIVFLTFVSLAILNYFNYDFFNQYLSELGIGSSAIFFNVGVMLTAILFILFFYLKFYKNGQLKMFILSLISAIALFLVGVFPIDHNLHYSVAALFFISSFFVILINSIILFRENKKKISIIGFILSLFVLFYMVVLEIPLFQKIAVFAIMICYLIFAFFDN